MSGDVRVEAALGEAFEQVARIVEPVVALRDLVDDLRVDAERLARCRAARFAAGR